MPYEKVGKNEPVCIADEVPFEIPDSWEWVRISDIFQIEMGQSPKGDSVGEFQHGIEFHQGKVYFGDKYIQESKQRTTTPTKIAEPNSVLLCVRAPVGKVNITNRKLCIGRGLCALKPLGNINIDFAFYLMETYESIFVKQATGTTFVAITGEIVKNQLIPLPPLGEQIRILEQIRELLPLIKDYAHVEQANEKLIKDFPQLLKKSILQEAVQGKLVPQDENDEPASVLLERIRAQKQALIKAGKIKKDKNESIIFKRDNSHYEKLNGIERCIDDEIPFEIPDGWEWVKLKNIAISSLGKTLDKVKNTGDFHPYLCSINVYWDRIDLTKIKEAKFEASELEKYRLARGDLLICEGGDVGRCCVWNDKQEMYYQNALHRVRFYGNINPYFFKYVIECYKEIGIIDNHSKGMTIKHLVQTELNNILFPLPSLNEQNRIVESIEKLLPYWEKL